jgi:hypothetical protein
MGVPTRPQIPVEWGVTTNHQFGDALVSEREMADSEKSEKGEEGELPRNEKAEVMCWKDSSKVCRCLVPRLGVFCGRYPLPTD